MKGRRTQKQKKQEWLKKKKKVVAAAVKNFPGRQKKTPRHPEGSVEGNRGQGAGRGEDVMSRGGAGEGKMLISPLLGKGKTLPKKGKPEGKVIRGRVRRGRKVNNRCREKIPPPLTGREKKEILGNVQPEGRPRGTFMPIFGGKISSAPDL